jgi:hypothetical protein
MTSFSISSFLYRTHFGGVFLDGLFDPAFPLFLACILATHSPCNSLYNQTNINATVAKKEIRLPTIAKIAGMPLVLIPVKPIPAESIIAPTIKISIQQPSILS